jgi:pimeloyl-ACP methyl ester carboxylesterase
MATVTSKDGTRIAYEKTGSGFPIILVDGAMCSRAFGPMPKLVPLLAEHFTVFSYDRRGRNESGDTKPYAPEREIEDIAALVEAAGGSAYLYGVSSGAVLALKATAKGLNVPKLALYEPPFRVDDAGHRAPSDSLEQLTAMIAADRRGDAVKFFIKDIVGVPGIFTVIMRFTPVWAKLKSVAHTLPYDITILGRNNTLPEAEAASVRTPTLIASGDKTQVMIKHAVKKLAEVMPNNRFEILKGQTHNVSEKAIAPLLIDFFKD